MLEHSLLLLLLSVKKRTVALKWETLGCPWRLTDQAKNRMFSLEHSKLMWLPKPVHSKLSRQWVSKQMPL